MEALARNGPVRTDPDTALHSVWAVRSPDVHRLLTRERGWDGTRYRAWLRTTLEALLLPAPGAPGLVIGAGADEEGNGAPRPRPRPEEPS